MPTLREIDNAIPSCQCCDDAEDAGRIARAVAGYFGKGNVISIELVRKIFGTLYGLPFCTDNGPERLAIAKAIAKVLK